MFYKRVILATTLLLMAGCSDATLGDGWFSKVPEMNVPSSTGNILQRLPAAKVKPVVALYEFTDQTGQHKANEKLADFSRAVTQGGASIISESLVKAGGGSWFTVIERNGLDHLLRERQIIAATRAQYGADSKLPPMLYAGVLLEGGIISYETNTLTGGTGARFLGVGGNTEYRQDVVTVYLRAINVQNGEVLISVNSAKTIYSMALSGGAYRFTALNELLETETGVTVNEPPQFAVRQAIESAVYSMIMEGSIKGLWEFAEPEKARLETQRYLSRVHHESLPEIEDVKPVAIPPLTEKIEAEDTQSVPLVVSAPVMVAPAVVATPSAVSTVTTPIPETAEDEAPLVEKLEEELPPVELETPALVNDAAEEKNAEESTPRKRYNGRSDINNSRYSGRVHDPRTNMYCTQNGCYPFPKGEKN
jgi:curli production assembly/transport component CsgG